MERLILPTFLTSGFLAELLQWSRSHQRRFIESSAKKPYSKDAPTPVPDWKPDPNDFYESLLDLLRLPYGGQYMFQTLKSFDTQHMKRSIEGRVFMRVVAYPPYDGLGVPNKTCARIAGLCLDGKIELAAELTWARLHMMSGFSPAVWSQEANEIFAYVLEKESELADYMLLYFESLKNMAEAIVQELDENKGDAAVQGLNGDSLKELPAAGSWQEIKNSIVEILTTTPVADVATANRIVALASELRQAADHEAQAVEKRQAALENLHEVSKKIAEGLSRAKLLSPEARLPSSDFANVAFAETIDLDCLLALTQDLATILEAVEVVNNALAERAEAAEEFRIGAAGALDKVIASNTTSEAALNALGAVIEIAIGNQKRAFDRTLHSARTPEVLDGDTFADVRLEPVEGISVAPEPDRISDDQDIDQQLEHLAAPEIKRVVDLRDNTDHCVSLREDGSSDQYITNAVQDTGIVASPSVPEATIGSEAVDHLDTKFSRDVAPNRVTPVLAELHVEDREAQDEAAATSIVEFDRFGDPAIADLKATTESVLASLLAERRYGLAFEVSRAWTATVAEMPAFAPPVVFQALSIGAAVQGGTALSAATRFEELKEPLFDALSNDSITATPAQLLAFAAALRPALFSPHASASELVRWGARHEALYALGNFVADLTGRLGRPLILADLAPVLDRQLRATQAQAATTTLIQWAESAQKQTLKYAPATAIWTSLFKSGLLAVALDRVRTGHKDRISSVKSAIELLQEPEDLLDKLDNEPRTVLRIEAGARQRLLGKMADASGQLTAWLDAQLRISEGEPSRHVMDLTGELHRLLRSAKTKIESEITGADLHVRQALRVVEGTVGDILLAFEGVSDDRPLSLDQKLSDDLLLVNDLVNPLAAIESWSAENARQFILGLAARRLNTWQEAFEYQISSKQFDSAWRVLERLKLEEENTDDKQIELISAYETNLHHLQEQAAALRLQVDILLGADAENRIEPSLSNRLDGLTDSIKQLPTAGEQPADLSLLFRQCDDLRVEIDTAYDVLIDPLRTKIAVLRDGGHDVTELEAMADRQDLATLAEHIEAVEKGFVLQPVNPNDSLLGEYSASLTADGDDRSFSELKKSIEAGGRHGTSDYSQLSERERQTGGALINAWLGVRTGQYGDAAGVQGRERAIIDLFVRLGFTKVRITNTTPFGNGRCYGILCEPLENRDFCAIPAFGSEAKGRYNVVVVEKTPTDDLFSVFQKHADPSGANILVLVGNLSRAKRATLIQAARRETNGLAAAFVDDSVISFLAGRPNRRLSDFFDISIAQGVAQPYSDQATQTSVEMFFGRREELKQLWNPRGSCLVYGGRQLGKTALLKQLCLQYHNPPNHYVLYGSYDEYGDGAKYPTTDFWKRIGELMVEAELTKTKPVSRAQVEERILEFVNRDPRNRIVLLIDEADKILKSEIQNDYPVIAPIKANLMEKTDYRCKFVFAGLHNVQRSARSPNSPLLHFGKAIEVGPLFRSDIQQAWAMVERPLNAVGYYFAERSIIGRVLSLVGYYPSFVQAFCKGLIERLNKKVSRRVPDGFLPFVVTAQDVDDAARDETFSGSLQDKFEGTLNLDERYRLITYALLITGFERRAAGDIVAGYSDVDVQRLALKWWPAGFSEDSSLDAFQGLLDEMVGLGVLVKQADGRYWIRSARIAAMLGGADAISQKIIELVDKKRPPALDPGHIRRIRDDRVSPLSERQERMLLDNHNPVQLAIGSTALGYEWLAPHIERLSDYLPDELKFQTFRKIYNNGRDLIKLVEAAAADAQRGNSPRKLSWVVATGPWPDADMLSKLADHHAIQLARRGKPNSVRVIIVPNEIGWEDYVRDVESGTVGPAAVLPLTPLGPSALHFWLAALTSQTPNSTEVNQIRRLTGGYPRYLSNMKGQKPSEIIEMAERSIEKLVKERNIWQDLGVYEPVLMAAIREAENLGGLDIELLEAAGVDRAADIIHFLVAMGVLERTSPDGHGEFVLNPLASYLLSIQAKSR